MSLDQSKALSETLLDAEVAVANMRVICCPVCRLVVGPLYQYGQSFATPALKISLALLSLR
jgi:hypothetical protein